MLEIEPHVAGIAAVHVPQEGIVDFVQVCHAMMKKIEDAGGRVATRVCVNKIEAQNVGWLVRTAAGDWEADYVVQLRRPALRPRGRQWPAKSAMFASFPSAASIFKIKTGAATSRAPLDLSGARSAIPLSGSSFHALESRAAFEAGPNAVAGRRARRLPQDRSEPFGPLRRFELFPASGASSTNTNA